jgi:hypothetical protein
LLRKEVITVLYVKPDVVVLGEASRLIQGFKSGIVDPPLGQGADSELEE